MRDEVRDIGEKALIRNVLADYALTARPDQIDDCMVVDLSELAGVPDLPYLVYSVDHPGMIDRPLPAGLQVRFRGRWAAACTCNDVLAMGARPVGFAIDLAMPDTMPVAAIREFYDGVTDVLSTYGARLEGGNIDANSRFETVAMCWGVVAPAGIIRRGGARLGDHLAITTEIGWGWATYLLREQRLWTRLSAVARTALTDYNVMPLAPHRAILDAVAEVPGAITSGMDLTDGLLEFAYTVNDRTGLGVRIEETAVPVSPVLAECAGLLDVPAPLLALEFGFDTPRIHGYTVDPARWETVSAVFARHGTPLYRIGCVTAEPYVHWVPASGDPVPLPRLWHDQCSGEQFGPAWFTAIRSLADRLGNNR